MSTREDSRTKGDFRERFSTRLHTCAPASHPVLEGVTSPQRGRSGGRWSRRRRCVGEDTVHVFPPPTSPRWGEARSPSTLPWTTTREVLLKKSPKNCRWYRIWQQALHTEEVSHGLSRKNRAGDGSRAGYGTRHRPAVRPGRSRRCSSRCRWTNGPRDKRCYRSRRRP